MLCQTSVDLVRLVAVAIASCHGAIVRTVLPPPEYVYAVDGVTCTATQCMRDDPTVMYSACCVRAIHREFPDPPKRLPVTLGADDVKAGIAAIRDSINACQDYPGEGVVKMRVDVAPSGAVTAAVADPPSGDDAFDTCLAAAFRRAHFPESRGGVRIKYPILR
jgi:hypothetical protein